MRHLLCGVALAALLAAGLPAAAQTKDASPPASTGMSSGEQQGGTTGATEPGTKGKKHAGKHKAKTKATKTSAGHQRSPDMAEQLNREELDRVQQGGGQMPASGTSSGGMPGAPTSGRAPQQ
jgi:hypothetical protein